MKSLKFIHCADIHLDAPFKEYGTGTYADTRRKDIRNAFKNILDRVKKENAQMLLISGDLYEHKTVSKSTMEWLYMVLSGVEAPVVIIPGNHDPYIMNSWYKSWEWPANVSILSPDNPQLVIESLDVNIYGMGFSSFREEKPDLSIVTPPEKNMFNIFMFHGTLDMCFTNQAYKPISSLELETLGYDYYALGHFHGSQDNYPLKNAYNPGSPEPLGFDEPGVHGALVVTMKKEDDSVSIEAQKFDTANRVYHDKDIDITGFKTLEEVKIRILGFLEGYNSERDIVRINLKGRTELSLETDTLSSFFDEDWLYLKIINDTRKAFDLDELVMDPSLKGAFVRDMKGRIEKVAEDLEKDPDNIDLQKEKERINLALSYGLEALITGKIEWLSEF